MKAFILGISLLVSMGAQAKSWQKESKAILKEYSYACKSSEMVVDSIVKNDYIKGHVKGLPTDAMKKFKVLVYVKTNRWYIHPYAWNENHGEGYSYAHLNENGEFKIRTVLRVPASEMVAMLVPRPVKVSNQKFWLKPIWGIFGGVKYQCTHTHVQGNGDFKN